jgi:HSP20 family molecular chaperone IbpA
MEIKNIRLSDEYNYVKEIYHQGILYINLNCAYSENEKAIKIPFDQLFQISAD